VKVPAQSQPQVELERDGTHIVDFYGDEQDLALRIAHHLAGALANEGSAIAVTTPSRRQQLVDAMGVLGFDVERAQQDGTLVLLDAAETLDRLLVDGHLDAGRFDATVGQLLRSCSQPDRPPHIFGEIVALLWEDGRVTEAMELEDLWNDLGTGICFHLYCAYHSELVADPRHADDVGRVCALHSSVVGLPHRAEASGSEVCTRIFPADVGSASLARRFVQETLADCSPPVVDDVVMATSELAANAVIHGRSDFLVTITRWPEGLRVSVSDAGPGQPALQSSGRLDPGGRGLHLVDSLATYWGVERDAPGKIVWAHFELASRSVA
jgi:anti-sigma regulatory factor (Ser/Thr protein kinase)